ncbi:MarR family winged helix-turn-helix transcriptional regulator [Nocardioides kribbensis]|uniref:MarR family transcriptional regulator n=1 Tax=Nocardioides kribbensis TaxID=305517 RepID=A0ABV1NZE2_9ACTN
MRVRHELARRSRVSDSELSALEHLVREPMGPAELARLLEVSTAASTGVVDRLQTKGHVQREPHAEDRRRTVVTLTDSGRAEILGHLMPMFEALRALDADLDDTERAVVARYLRGAAAAFETVTGPPPAPRSTA